MKYGAFIHDKIYIFNNQADAEEFVLACVEESAYNTFCTWLNIQGYTYWETMKNRYTKGGYLFSETFENHVFRCSMNPNDYYIVEAQEVNWNED